MKKHSYFQATFVLFFIVALVLSAFSVYVQNFNDHAVTFTVTDKERVNTQDSSYFLVFGEDENGDAVVYQNTDAFIRGKFDSSTMQAKLQEGKTYEVTLVGYRFPLFSSYENILSAKEIK